MRRVAALAPADVPADVSDAQLARQLVWDTVAALTRAEVVLSAATEAVIAHTEQQQRANDLRANELELARRQIEHAEREAARDARREAQWQRTLAKAGAGAAGWAATILFDQRVITSIVTLIATAVAGLLASWGFGVHLSP